MPQEIILPPEGTVRRWFHYFKRTGQYEKINEQLRKAVRVQVGREAEPSLAIIDSQSVKSTRTSGERGDDAGKKINGIKRYFLVDVLGLILFVVVHTANISVPFANSFGVFRSRWSLPG